LHGEAALTQQGYVMVEAIDALGNVIDPFSRERCLWVNVNDLGRPVAWTGTSLSALVGSEVTLRFHTRDARVYSLHNVPSPGAVAAASLHESPAPDTPKELTLTLAAAQLVAWETTGFNLSGRTARDQALNMDEAQIEFLVEGEGRPLQIESDKRDRQTGHATLAGDVSAPRGVAIRAQA